MTQHHHGWRVLLVLLMGLLALPALATPLKPEQIPPPLREWKPWVLHNITGLACPLVQSQDQGQRLCQWPGRLHLDLSATKGHFEQEWLLHEEGWVPLPGDDRLWPQDVLLNGKPAIVTNHDDKPALWLASGRHRVEGGWRWPTLPESMAIAPETGLVKLVLEGQEVAAPNLQDGRLWPTQSEPTATEEDHHELVVVRKVVDEIPLQLVTRIELNVAGKQREITLPQPLHAGWIPVSLTAPLPTRLEENSQLRVQARPGQWVLELVQRQANTVTSLEWPEESTAPNWPSEEVWSFEARNGLRMVSVEGAPSIDPRQTTLPSAWRGLPAFLMKPGQKVLFKERQRGNANPPPDQLHLTRTWWLDAEGGGFTIQDQLRGEIHRATRLEMESPIALGRAALNNDEQVITLYEKRNGVEVRPGALTLQADSRLTFDTPTLPAVGWHQDMQSLAATLNLPPGWRLWAVQGVDSVQGAWLEHWTLLDIFLVLLIALTSGKLWGRRWSLFALLAMILIHHDQEGFAWLLLNMLVLTALVRVIPVGRFHKALVNLRWLALIALLVHSAPFLVEQARLALYPRLDSAMEEPIFAMDRDQVRAVMAPAPMAKAMPRPEPEPRVMLSEEYGSGAAEYESRAKTSAPPPPREVNTMVKGSLHKLRSTMEASQRPSQSQSQAQRSLREIDPNAHAQTGPGLPQWQGAKARLQWNGPVRMNQQLRFWLTAPEINRWLAVGRMAGVLLFLLLLLERWPLRWRPGAVKMATIASAALLLTILLPTPTAHAELPSKELLEQLQQRLLEPAPCLPNCATIGAMTIEAEDRQLRLRLEIHAEDAVAVALPGQVEHWTPRTVLLDGTPSNTLARDGQGALLLPMERGRHQVVLEGALTRDSVQLTLPLLPRLVLVKSNTWRVDGVDKEGIPRETVQLSRNTPLDQQEAAKREEWQPRHLPPLLSVERTLTLGLEWRVHTRVLRLSPAVGAVIQELPLLPGESITSAGLRTEPGKVWIDLSEGVSETAWDSVLTQNDELLLKAGTHPSWFEVWRLDAALLWHVESSGIPPVVATGPDTLPQWRPWPGEELRLRVTRPAAAPGRTVTLERSTWTITPGLHATDNTLILVIKSSQGGEHPLTLPEGAELLAVKINNSVQPIRLNGRLVTVPLTPGEQEVVITWRTSQSIGPLLTTPALNLGSEGVNAHIHIKLPPKRWLLWTGGGQNGPVVLFWGGMVVIVLFCIGLSRIPGSLLRLREWILLGLGLSTASLWVIGTVVAWFLFMGWRRNAAPIACPLCFNLRQIALALLTLLALSALFDAIKTGLLGHPDMQVLGNNSTTSLLRWYQDRHTGEPASVVLISAPILAYRLFMLAWALWLAAALPRWAKQAWQALSTNGLWRPLKEPAPTPAEAASEPAPSPTIDTGEPAAPRKEE